MTEPEAEGKKGRPPAPADLPSYLSKKQVGVLLDAIKPHRVGSLKRSGKVFSHVEAYEIRAHLNRLIGFARWSEEVTAMELIAEKFHTLQGDNGPRDVVTVAYRAQLRLTIHAPDGTLLAVYTEWAAGDAINQPAGQWPDAHDQAMKTAESQALKRCAANLGDQFGLSLYRGGSLNPLVMVTLLGGDDGSLDLQDAAPDATSAESEAPPADDEGTPYGHGEPPAAPEPPRHGTSSRAAAAPAVESPAVDEDHPPAPTADELAQRIKAATRRSEVAAALRIATQSGQELAIVADEDENAVQLGALAARKMKALGR